jgi:hypothetical protein
MSDDLNRQPIYSISVAGVQATSSVAILDEPTFQFSTLTCHPNLLLTKTVYADGPDKPYDHAKTFRYKYSEIRPLDKFAGPEWPAATFDKARGRCSSNY